MPRLEAGDQTGKAQVFDPPPEWMQPNSLSLDRSVTFSRDEAPLGLPNLRCSADLRPSAVGSASGRAGAYVATTGASFFELGRAAGPDDSPANLHDRVCEPYG
jgi:hypothetical protein